VLRFENLNSDWERESQSEQGAGGREQGAGGRGQGAGGESFLSESDMAWMKERWEGQF